MLVYPFVGIQEVGLSRRKHHTNSILWEKWFKTQENSKFIQKIIWSNDATFGQQGTINRKNWQYWVFGNPHFVTNTLCQNSLSRIILCSVINYAERTTIDVLESCWYQLDEVHVHSTYEVYPELVNHFEDRSIGKDGRIDNPPDHQI